MNSVYIEEIPFINYEYKRPVSIPFVRGCEDACMSIPFTYDCSKNKDIIAENWNISKKYIEDFKKLHPSKKFILIIPIYYDLLEDCLTSDSIRNLGLSSRSEDNNYDLIRSNKLIKISYGELPYIYSVDSDIVTTIDFLDPSNNKVLSNE